MPLNDIGQDRFQNRLTRELRIKGNQPAPVLAPEIQPVIVVEGERPELLYLQDERRYSASLSHAAVAAEYFYAILVNPAGSGMLAVWEGFGICDGTGVGIWDWGGATTASWGPLGARNALCMDTRVTRAPRCTLYVGTDGGAGGINNTIGRLAESIFDIPLWVRDINLVLSPGQQAGIWNNTVNHINRGTTSWRERRAEDGELR
jgi:hypothetical protein